MHGFDGLEVVHEGHGGAEYAGAAPAYSRKSEWNSRLHRCRPGGVLWPNRGRISSPRMEAGSVNQQRLRIS